MSDVIFVYKESEMSSFIEVMKNTKSDLLEAYEALICLHQELIDTHDWNELGKDKLIAYVNLLSQYLGGICNEWDGGDSPMDRMIGELNKFSKDMGNFYQDSEAYAIIKNL